MNSPFPGMDPYLEQSWGDVHSRLITYASDQLNEQLPRDLRCRVEERVLVEPGADEPMLLSVASEPATETYIEIIDLATGRAVVTVIEFLGLANKTPGLGQRLYHKKQREIQRSRVNLVEIDLLRDGKRIQACRESVIPFRARTPYRACVRRASKPKQFEYYPISLRERLPNLRIPLRATDADVVLRLQPLIEQCYRLGRYDDIDYRLPPRTSSERARRRMGQCSHQGPFDSSIISSGTSATSRCSP
jgi:hypothetical protein